MRYFDIVKFDVDAALTKRLGYHKVYVVGKDLEICHGTEGLPGPKIVLGWDPGVLARSLKQPDVVGMVFEGKELNRKLIEKAAELEKNVFVPIRNLLSYDIGERVYEMRRVGDVVAACHKLGARAKLITLAEDVADIISVGQLKELSCLFSEDGYALPVFDGGLI